jgi:hypothetical protein
MNYRTPQNIAALQLIISDYNSLLDEFAIVQIHRGSKLKTLQKICNDFLNRTRINNEALIPLLENYKTKRSAILPIGLLIRSILSDFLAFCYLATFSHSKDPEEVSIENELDLLERDFLKSMMEVSELESKIHEYNQNIPPAFEDNKAYEDHVEKVKNQFKHLFKEENTKLRFKKPSEFRETSLPDCFDSKDEFATAPSFITEKYKWERMLRRGFSKYVIVFTAFKFFSQFQHYSPMSAELIKEVSEAHAFFHLIMAIDSILIVTDMQIQIIDGKESKYLPRLREIEKKLDGILGDQTEGKAG